MNEVEVVGDRLCDIENWNVSGFPERAGWYYQQFVKLAFARSALAQHRFLVWDADTIPMHEMSVFDGDKLVFTQGDEFHIPYFETNRTLIGVDRAKTERYSAISQHMPVDRAIMLELLNYLDSLRGRRLLDDGH